MDKTIRHARNLVSVPPIHQKSSILFLRFCQTATQRSWIHNVTLWHAITIVCDCGMHFLRRQALAHETCGSNTQSTLGVSKVDCCSSQLPCYLFYDRLFFLAAAMSARVRETFSEIRNMTERNAGRQDCSPQQSLKFTIIWTRTLYRIAHTSSVVMLF